MALWYESCLGLVQGSTCPEGRTGGPQRLAVVLYGPPDLHLNPIYVTRGSLPTACSPSSVDWEREPCIVGSSGREVRGRSRRASAPEAGLQPSVPPELGPPGRACATVGVRSQEGAGMSRVSWGSALPSRSGPEPSRLAKAISECGGCGWGDRCVLQCSCSLHRSAWALCLDLGAQSPNLRALCISPSEPRIQKSPSKQANQP